MEWKQTGKLYLWRYLENTRNYSGWNIAFNRECRESMMSLVSKILKNRVASIDILKISKPTRKVLRIPNNMHGKAKWESPSRLIFVYNGENSQDWSIIFERGIMVWVLGLKYLKEVCRVFKKPYDYFDDAVGYGPCVWVWGVTD